MRLNSSMQTAYQNPSRDTAKIMALIVRGRFKTLFVKSEWIRCIFSYAQTANTSKTKQNSLNNTFHPVFDTFVVPGSVNSCGICQSHNSSNFKPGEKIVLYMEPKGYSYKSTLHPLSFSLRG